MVLMDITALLIVAIIHRYSHVPRLTEIVYFEFLAGIIVGYLTPLLNLYDLIHPAWFFVLRAYIMLGALLYMVIENASRTIGAIVVSGIFYNLAMFYEYGLQLNTAVDTYYTPFMVTNMLLQIIYVFRVSDIGTSIVRWSVDFCRSITDRYFCGIMCSTIT